MVLQTIALRVSCINGNLVIATGHAWFIYIFHYVKTWSGYSKDTVLQTH